MPTQADVAEAWLAGLAGFIAGTAATMAASFVVPTGSAFLLGTIAGGMVWFFVLVARQRSGTTWVRDAREANIGAMRHLVHVVVPGAALHAADDTGHVDVERFRELVAGSIGAMLDPALGIGEGQDNVWKAASTAPRTPDQQRRLDLLETYPDASEAAGLLAELDGMGPQTIHMMSIFSQTTREWLSVGQECALGGPEDAALTRHLMAAGLVARAPGPASVLPGVPSSEAYYCLTGRGYEVARLFSPTAPRPQELAELDPPPPRPSA